MNRRNHYSITNPIHRIGMTLMESIDASNNSNASREVLDGSNDR